ncbi:MAG: PLP-dependent aminotransferase family protein [Chloroflexia bacterium]|nr:PLP-dependent aminotransferase family protein [Chloroflexia bacterium]
MTTQWQVLLSEGGRNIRGSAVRDLFKVVQRPGMISFAGGMPAPEMFPCEVVSEACAKVMRENGTVALQYGQTEGYDPLRDFIAQVWMADLGLRAGRENILVTTGGLQISDLLPKILLNPGEALVLEAPTFLGALACFSPYCPRYISIPVDVCGAGPQQETGLDVDALESVLAQEADVKFIYVMPNFHNPVGCTLGLQRRKKLVALADYYGVPVLEDDPYSQLRYSGEPLPPLIVLDQQQLGLEEDGAFEQGNVLYAGSFSKILSPGMRLGWVAGPAPIIARLARAKQGVDLHTSLVVQMIAYELCSQGFFPGHIARIRELYGRRRDWMLQLMQEYFPPAVSWTHPQGGLFIWVTLPEGLEAQSLLMEAVEERVAFVPGQSFFTDDRGANTFRLNFSNASEDNIEQGISRLGQVLRKALTS